MMDMRLFLAMAAAVSMAAMVACQPSSAPPGDGQAGRDEPGFATAQPEGPQGAAGAHPTDQTAEAEQALAREADETEATAMLDGPMSEGSWTVREMETGPAALFGEPATEAAFTIRCDRDEQAIFIARAGRLEGVNQALLTIATPAETWRYYVEDAGTELPVLQTRIRATDSALERLAAAEGPIAVRLAERDAVLRMPADPAIGQVVEACRDGAAAGF